MQVLITGLSGYLGQYLYFYRPKKITISGTYYRNKRDKPAQKMLLVDLESIEAFTKTSGTYDLVIHAAANSSLADCEHNKQQAFRVNCGAAEILARWSQRQGSRFIYLSTDIVFQGDRGDYSEEDQPNPVNIYGQSKWQGERVLAINHSNYAICRLSLILGKARGASKNFIDHFVKNLQAGCEIPLFIDELRTPITPHYAARAIWEVALSGFKGTIHLCGVEKISRYQLGIKIARYLNLTVDRLNKTNVDQVVAYPRPLNVTLCSLFAAKALTLKQQKISDVLGDLL
jgi:dTDP-4-dehydrorhamnose reductase